MYQILLATGFCAGLITVVRPIPSSEVAPPENRQLAREDLKKLQGTWERVAMEVEGKVVPAEDLKSWLTIYEGDQLILKVDGKVYRQGVTTLNPARTPKAINTWDSSGLFRDQTLAGIYELEGDTFQVCFARPGKPRPTKFTTQNGEGFIYCRYKRQTPSTKISKPEEDCPAVKQPCRSYQHANVGRRCG